MTLIGIIVAIVLMGLLGAAVLMLVAVGSQRSLQALNQSYAFFAAESGLSAARNYMNTHTNWSTPVTGVMGQATFNAVIASNGVITSVGRQAEAQWTSIWMMEAFSRAMLVYGTRTNAGTPQYRIWDGSAWSVPAKALSVGSVNINWLVVKACPRRDEYIAVTLDVNRAVKAQVYRDGSWGNLQTITNVPNANYRGVDIAYESLSGDALVVAANGTADPTYYVWNGAVWTGPSNINLTRLGIVNWVKLAADPVSDEMIVMVLDANRYYTAQVWNGSNAWANEIRPAGQSVNVAYEAMDIEYETSGQQAIRVSNCGIANNGRFSWSSWSGTNWSSESTNTLGDYFRFGTLVNDPNSDKLLLTYVDNDSDIGKVYWSGSAWTAFYELETSANSAVDRCVQGQFETISGHAGHVIIPYSDTLAGRSRHATDPSLATWSTEVSVSNIQDSATVQTRRTGDGKMLAVFFDDANTRYDFSWHNGTAWVTRQTLENEPSVLVAPFKEPFMMAPQIFQP